MRPGRTVRINLFFNLFFLRGCETLAILSDVWALVLLGLLVGKDSSHHKERKKQDLHDTK
jgi:hypothetical protein